MARFLFRTIGGMTSALTLLSFAAAPAWAKDFNYDGDTSKLQDIANPNGNPNPITNAVAPSDSETGKSPDLANNRVTVTNGFGADIVFGSVNLLDSSAVTNNQVIIDGATIDGWIMGGWTDTVRGNSVTIKNGGLVNGYVFGGYSDQISGPATATGNSVVINGGTVSSLVVSQSGYLGVYGGSAVVESGSGAATATGNSVDIKDGAVTGNVHGGYASAEAGDSVDGPIPAAGPVTASNNKVNISGISVVSGNVYGGYANQNDVGPATASSNTVDISGGEVYGDVAGGHAYSESGTATANSNKVTISGGEVDTDVAGGVALSNSGNAQANSNTVDISGGEVYGDVAGGHAESNSGTATANSNKVTISGISIVDGWVSGGEAHSASGSATASGNAVTISDDGDVGGVSGGEAYSNSGTATASNNSVVISGGTVYSSVYGGKAESDFGNATATNNSVVISGGEVNGTVYGGYAESNDAGAATATHNTVTISGGTVNGEVLGGYAYSESGSATATYNTVSITGSPDLAGAYLYGGDTGGAGAGDYFTGNTLNVLNYSGGSASMTVGSVQNFQYYNFVFPTSQVDPVLIVNGTAFLGENDGVRNRSSIVTASTTGGLGTVPLQPGASVTLIDASSGALDTNGFTQTLAAGQHGATIAYLWTLDTTGDQLTATLRQVGARPEAKTLSEGYLSGMALLNQSGDLVAGQGMSAATNAAYLPNTAYGLGVFGTFSGGWMRYDTGSSVEMSSVSLMTGVAKHVEVQPGNLVIGAFFEYGNGSYDTYSAFHGEGDISHVGGGIIGRLNFNGTDRGHLYTEASFRVGSVDNDYNSNELRDILGRTARYDSSSTYYGIHLATGFIMNLTEDATLDLYGKYFWTRQDGDNLRLPTGDPVSFDDINSHRLRFGGRFSYAADQTVTPYIGAAWEHEFDGEAQAKTYGYSISAPSLEGDTGIGELGVTFRPSEDMPFYLDLAVQGYVGAREGATGSVQLRYDF